MKRKMNSSGNRQETTPLRDAWRNNDSRISHLTGDRENNAIHHDQRQSASVKPIYEYFTTQKNNLNPYRIDLVCQIYTERKI